MLQQLGGANDTASKSNEGAQASIMSQYNEQKKKHCKEDILYIQEAKELIKTGNALQRSMAAIRF